MKAIASKKPEYPSFDLIITIESNKEAAALYAIFNHMPIATIINRHAAIKAEAIKEAIADGHGKTPSYSEVHSDLCECLR